MNPLLFLPLELEDIILDYVKQLEDNDKHEIMLNRIRYNLVMCDLRRYFIKKGIIIHFYDNVIHNEHIQRENDWIECWRKHLN